ncbi:hypothetical protein HN51_010634 [Arachis hypogaea]|uniref:Uncharacterized protein n=1 Tax=Arachis hypogaea TaxID=3818 RepID=A0A445E2G4_ARAHY|nr:hypothetical protein Ahy_A03g016168 [Arachis hypogaea]
MANAHIQAYEIDSASGRYCIVERVVHFSLVTKILCADDKLYVPKFQVSRKRKKTQSLGVEFIPF